MANTERIFGDLTELADLVNTGAAGLPAIQGLVQLTQTALDAVGASFAEYGSAGGRVIAASGASLWAVGRRVLPADCRLADPGRHLVEVPVEQIHTEAGQLSERGIRRMLATRVEVAGQLMGTLHGYFPDAGPAATGTAARARAGPRTPPARRALAADPRHRAAGRRGAGGDAAGHHRGAPARAGTGAVRRGHQP